MFYDGVVVVVGGGRWRSVKASDSESRGPGIDPQCMATPCCVLEQDSLTPFSTG